MKEATKRQYKRIWLAIQSDTDRRLVTIIDEGLSTYQTSMAIIEDLGGFGARKS